MTELSGGQTRALLIADAVVIGNAPIILLDEIENAGIDRARALQLLKRYEKIFLFVTHDPTIALASDLRIIMRDGAIQRALATDPAERRAASAIESLYAALLRLRDRIRAGERVRRGDLDVIVSAFRDGLA
jgi:ABC-type lipoprotein export system ATPase subunit